MAVNLTLNDFRGVLGVKNDGGHRERSIRRWLDAIRLDGRVALEEGVSL